MKVELAPFSVKLDGVSIDHATSVTVRMRPEAVPEVDLTFLGLDDVTVIGGSTQWLAHAFGCSAGGDEPPEVLRMLADALDMKVRGDGRKPWTS